MCLRAGDAAASAACRDRSKSIAAAAGVAVVAPIIPGMMSGFSIANARTYVEVST
jgi:hypothetical protein